MCRPGGIERDRCLGSVQADQIDRLLEQLRLMAHTATNDDALPRMAAECCGNDGLHVVAAVEAE
jgi:hypothetical protein